MDDKWKEIWSILKLLAIVSLPLLCIGYNLYYFIAEFEYVIEIAKQLLLIAIIIFVVYLLISSFGKN